MKPAELHTKIFLDSCDPAQTRAVLYTLDFLDGQTTNPTLFAVHPSLLAAQEHAQRFTASELTDLYKKLVIEIAALLPQGDVSIEVYADATTEAQDMVEQARDMYTWIPNARIKLPITHNGLRAAEELSKEGMRLNMTLCFSQEQAAAVYAATQGAAPGQIFISPFIGRLDDRGENGIELVVNILRMYEAGDGHVSVLAASIRTLDQLVLAVQLGTPVLTAPPGVLLTWAQENVRLPRSSVLPSTQLRPIPYKEMHLRNDWASYTITHELTDIGLARFANDWQRLIKEYTYDA